jgi:hypothetical protein
MAFWVVGGFTINIGVSDGLGFGWLIVPWCGSIHEFDSFAGATNCYT